MKTADPRPDVLSAPLETLPGVGPGRRKTLELAGVHTVGDLLWHLPFRYEDRSRPTEVREVRAGGPYLVRAEVKAIRTRRSRRGGLTLTEALLSDATGSIHALWFNQPYLERSLPQGTRAYFYGQATLYPTRQGLRLQMDNPEVEKEGPAGADPIHGARIVPIYRKIGDIGSRTLRALLHGLLQTVAPDEVLPQCILQSEGLMVRAQAFRAAHFPDVGEDPGALASRGTSAHRRLIFEELFGFQLALQAQKKKRSKSRGIQVVMPKDFKSKVKGMLPFPLTGAQKRVLREIVADMASPAPMYRLLQGDVGSGKTIVASLAMVLAAFGGYQAAFLAPTEILGYQHYERLSALVGATGLRVVLLTASTRARERREALAALESGTGTLAVGTHSLFQEGVRYANLGLVIVDEQHRFGVEQRARMVGKGKNPDVLVMSATPIPRSLSLTLYGDLDLSVLDELPPGRQEVITAVRTEESRHRVESFLRAEMDQGKQVFVVYPLVDESETLDLRAATEAHERLRLGPFRGYPLALLHGRMPAKEKMEVMAKLRAGEIRMLVATSIVEVGVDLPTASSVVVEHAERFGLAQLHQLRGRVGRGGDKAYCILFPSKGISPSGMERLRILERTRDGFALAEEDLRLRGAGDPGGVRQWGGGAFRLANPLRDFDMLERARGWTERLARGETAITAEEKAILTRWIASIRAGRGEYAGIG